MRIGKVLSFLVVVGTLSNSWAAKMSAQEKGLSIAKKNELKNNGFIGEKSTMKMILEDAHNTKTTREMQGKAMEVDGDGDKSISIFLRPHDVKGTKMLTHSHKKGDDDQWLYLPSFKKVRRITSSNKSSSFMGSEFSYEDLGSQEPEKFHFKWLRDEKNNDVGAVWVLERKPKEKSAYSKQILWLSKKYAGPLKTEYYDRKGELLKVATFSNYKQFNVGKKTLWRANKIHMSNVQTKKKSTLTWENRKLGVKFSTREFDKRNLK